MRALAVLLLAAVLSMPEITYAAYPGANGSLAFYSRSGSDDSVSQLATLDPAGGTLADVPNTEYTYLFPSWSPDGNQLAFSGLGGQDIFTINVDGSGLLQLTNDPAPDYDPTWSPDGSQIAFRSVRNGQGDLYVIDADGTGFHNLTNDPESDFGPAWSPDGAVIAFSSIRAGNYDVYTVHPDGTGLTRLTSTPGLDVFPDWSPDSGQIAFASDRSGSRQIYKMNRDGTNQAQVTTESGGNGNPAWSPDGSRIAFDSSGSIYVIDVDGTGETLVTPLDAVDRRTPDWQPVVSPGYPRPKGASPFRVSLVPAYQACVAPNRVHGAPLSDESCAPPSQDSPNLTVGTPDANGAFAGSTGFLALHALAGTPGPPNDANVRLQGGLSDVRCRAEGSGCGNANAVAGPDYAGELAARIDLRITDKLNSPDPAGTGPATMTDYTFTFAIPCTATASTSTGGSCAIDSDFNAVAPGIVPEGKRSIWELGAVAIDDGGPDGVASTADNSRFETQGLFAP